MKWKEGEEQLKNLLSTEQDAGASETRGPSHHGDTDNTFVKNKCS